jgi:hypothetical protein
MTYIYFLYLYTCGSWKMWSILGTNDVKGLIHNY